MAAPPPPAPTLTEQLSGFAAGLSAAASDLGDQVAAAARSAAQAVLPAQEQPPLLQRSPGLQRSLAALRWGSFGGYQTTVPIPSGPIREDTRLVLALANLAKVLVDEFRTADAAQHAAAAAGRAGGGGADGPDPSSVPLVPPVTLALVALTGWRFLTPVLLRDVALSPYSVVERGELHRAFTGALAHMDATHLATNLAVLLPDAIALERARGSGPFLLDLASLTALSSGLFVGWAVLQKEVLHKPEPYYTVGAIGLSSVAFGLQVVAGEARRGTCVHLFGVPLPSQFAWALQLALTHTFVPDASFAGHMCGVLAGIAHVYLLQPALGWLRYGAPLQGGAQQAARPRVWGAGTTGGRRIDTRAGAGGGRPVLRQALARAAVQLGLAAGGVLLYVLAHRGGRQRQAVISSWRP